MSLDTIIQQGRFTSTGQAVDLHVRSDVDWIYVYNETILNDLALASDRGAWFQWFRGMTQGRGIEYRKLGTVANDPISTRQIATNSGFFLIDSTAQNIGAPQNVTAISNATRPVMTTGSTGQLVTGSIVRLSSDTGVPNIMGFDFEVDNVVLNTSFRMRWELANAPGVVGNGDGQYRHVEFDPIFYPRRRFIVNITRANQAQVRTSVSHGYQVGQEVRFSVPAAFGMQELDGMKGSITAINTANNTFDVDIDSSAFTAFTFPGVGDVPYRFAEVTPVGMDTAEALDSNVDVYSGASRNTGFIGVRLMPGNSSPAGVAGNVIYWIAGSSSHIDNR